MGERHSRRQSAASLVRMTPREREFLLEAANRKSAELATLAPGSRMGLTQFIKSAALRWAEKILDRPFKEG